MKELMLVYHPVKKEIRFIPVESVETVFELALCEPSKSAAEKRGSAVVSRVSDGVRCGE